VHPFGGKKEAIAAAQSVRPSDVLRDQRLLALERFVQPSCLPEVVAHDFPSDDRERKTTPFGLLSAWM
jgi:hypothetical protein